MRGEKWGSTLTDIVRRFPFPDAPGSQFTPEGLVWLDIAKTYKNRCVNEVFRIYYVGDAHTGATLSKRRSFEDAPGRLYYYLWLLNNDLGYFLNSPLPFLKAAVMLPIVARLSGKSLRSIFGSLWMAEAKLLVLLAVPVSYLLLVFDRSLRSRVTTKSVA
jgi:hypothetical protein